MTIEHLSNASTEEVPQHRPLENSQVENRAGGFVYEVDKWVQLERFLVLGTEGSTYYASEREQTFEGVQCLDACINEDGVAVVRLAMEVSDSGRAIKNDPAIFALARVLAKGEANERRAAAAAVPSICRTGTHIFTFVKFTKQMRGTGRLFRRAISAWYEQRGREGKLEYQMVKYRNRHGFTHADLLRLAHTNLGNDASVRALAGVKGKGAAKGDPESLTEAYLGVGDVPVHLRPAYLENHPDLPREALPTEWLQDPKVWGQMLDNRMPMGALIRNLGVMTANETLTPMGERVEAVCQQIVDEEAIKRARVHPIQILAALSTYRQGHGARGKLNWAPISVISDALDSAFYLAFQNVEPTNKRTLLALDVSGSMGWGQVGGVPGLTPAIGSAAMALVTARTEPAHQLMAFSTEPVLFDISSKASLGQLVGDLAQMPMGGTDCAIPMQVALNAKIEVDQFVIYTDNETWAGVEHPKRALDKYREKLGIDAKLAVVAMTSTGYSIADPNDPGMMDFVGFDTATPNAISEFARL